MKRKFHIPSSPFLLFLLGVITFSLAGFSALAMLDGMQYRAVKIGSDRNIDDNFNKMAAEGWYPQFVLKFEGDNRLIYERPRDEEARVFGLEYRAEVIRSGKEIDDSFNKMAKDGWFPRFVFRTGTLNQNWRLIMERDPDAPVQDFEYSAVLIGQGNQVDDKFNQMAADGWYPLFIVEGVDDLRMLFARDPNDTEPSVRFMAKTTRNIKQIDDLFNEHGADGWEPIFLFKDENDSYRALFQMDREGDVVPLEFQSRRIEEMSEIDDKFNQYSADGWYPIFVLRDVEELLEDYTNSEGKKSTRTVDNVRWRMLFGRIPE